MTLKIKLIKLTIKKLKLNLKKIRSTFNKKIAQEMINLKTDSKLILQICQRNKLRGSITITFFTRVHATDMSIYHSMKKFSFNELLLCAYNVRKEIKRSPKFCNKF